MPTPNSKSGPAIPGGDTLFTNTYQSISGVDIKATFAGSTFGNLQAISYSVTREKAPVYSMGSPEPRGYSRGKRGVAGSLVFIMFDQHALLGHFRHLAEGSVVPDSRAVASVNGGKRFKFVSDKDEPRPRVQNLGNVNTNPQGGNIEGSFSPLTSGLSDAWSLESPWYSDQIPPFNVVLTGVNEFGMASSMSVLGVEILNEGYGISIDDINSEQQMTYVARGVAPWSRVTPNAFTDARYGNFTIPAAVDTI